MTGQGASQGVTRILVAWNDGGEGRWKKLVPLGYQELRRLGRHQRKRPHQQCAASSDERI